MDAVGANDHIHRLGAAIRELQRDTGIGVPQRGQAFAERHLRRAMRLGQCGQHIGAVDRDLWRAVFFLGHVRHAKARGFLAGVPVTADAKCRARTALAHGRANVRTQSIERTNGVRCQVDVRADTGKLPGLLIDRDPVAMAAQRNGRCHAADAATDDANMQWIHDFCSSVGSCRSGCQIA